MSASFEAQIASLRSELARTQRLTAWAVLGICAVALVAAAHPADVVRAQRFEVVDANGDVRAILTGSEQSAELHLIGGSGDLIYLSAMYGTTRLSMNSEGWRHGPRVWLGTTADGSRFELADDLGIQRVTAGTAGESQWVRAFDRSGTVRAEMGGNEERTQHLFVGDPHGGPALSLSADSEGTSVDLGD